MTSQKDQKITVLQALLLFMTMAFSPAVRIISGNAAQMARQAGWLTTIPSFFAIILLVLIVDSVYKKYKEKSFMDFIYDILGTWIGKLVVFFYFAHSTILTALYIRYFAERIVLSIFPYVNINIFIISILIVIAFILRNGIVNIARMNEIIFFIINLIFFVLIFMLLLSVDIKNLTPISYYDILPIMHGSISVTGIWVYILAVLFIGYKIRDKENIKKYGIVITILVYFLTTLLIIASIGTIGADILADTPLSFLLAVREISFFGFIERVEAVLVATWILSDFIIINVFSFVSIEIIKSLFNLKETKPLTNIYIILVYYLSIIIANNIFELKSLSNNVLIYANVIFGLLLPALFWGIGKVMRKV